MVSLSALLAVDATAATAPPSAARMHQAVVRAERSGNVWATVNICDSRRYPNYLGIRGQMPALGFAAWLSMDIRLSYYSQAKKTYVPVPKRGSKLVRLGRSSRGLQQGGALFRFAPHQPTIRATVGFFWRRSGRLLGETTRLTTAGHHNADFGSPPRYSAGVCKIR